MRGLVLALVMMMGAALPAMANNSVQELAAHGPVLVFSDLRASEFGEKATEQLSLLNAEDMKEMGMTAAFLNNGSVQLFSFDRKGRLIIETRNADRRLAAALNLKKTRFSAALINENGELVQRFTTPVQPGALATLLGQDG